MKYAPSANSSDLDRARELSRKLRPEEPVAASRALNADAGTEGFLRFRAAKVASVAPRAPLSPAAVAGPRDRPAVLDRPVSPRAGGSWGPFLDWCRRQAGSESAFAIDAQGLIISASGAIRVEEAEAMGSRTMIALEQALRMTEAAVSPSVAFDLGGSRLSGFSVSLSDGSRVTFGLVGPEAVGAALRATFQEAFDLEG